VYPRKLLHEILMRRGPSWWTALLKTDGRAAQVTDEMNRIGMPSHDSGVPAHDAGYRIVGFRND